MDEDYARKLRNWLRAEPTGTPAEREWLRGIPEPASDEQDASPDRWTVRGQLPEVAPDDDDWICPVIALPVPRPSRENGCRMSGVEVRLRWTRPANAAPMTDAEARSRWNHPSNVDSRTEAPGVRDGEPSAADAEARSRWNHPTNWHRRRREAEQRRRDEPGSR